MPEEEASFWYKYTYQKTQNCSPEELFDMRAVYSQAFDKAQQQLAAIEKRLTENLEISINPQNQTK